MTIWQKLTEMVAAAGLPSALLGQARRTGGDADAATDIRFTMALIALCAKMARSDGAVTIDEVDAFKRIVVVTESEEGNVRRLFDLAKRDVAGFEEYARQIGGLFAGQHKLLRDVLEAMFVIAAADGVLHEREEHFLALAARHLAIPESEFAHIRSLFVKDASSPYAALGLTPAASDAELRARHRALVIEHHPDKLTGRGVPAEFVAVAERKLAAINAAYDAIAKERGL